MPRLLRARMCQEVVSEPRGRRILMWIPAARLQKMNKKPCWSLQAARHVPQLLQNRRALEPDFMKSNSFAATQVHLIIFPEVSSLLTLCASWAGNWFHQVTALQTQVWADLLSPMLQVAVPAGLVQVCLHGTLVSSRPPGMPRYQISPKHPGDTWFCDSL